MLGRHLLSLADFRLLAERLGMVAARAKRIVARFSDEEAATKVDSLIARSFLNHDAKEHFRAVVFDRRRALR